MSKFQLRTMTALFRISGDSGQIPLELWPSWRHKEENISSVTWCLLSQRLRSAICCQILSFNRRIYLRLPLLMQLDMPQGMCPYMKDHSLGLPRRLRRLSGGPSLRLRHPGDALNLRLLLLHCSALKHPLLRSVFTPQKKSPDPPRGFFGGRSLSSLCGPVGFRGVAPHHRPIHPEHFHRIPAISHGSLPHGRSLLSARVLCFGLTTAPHVFTRLMAPKSTILHRYVVGMLRYLDDWLILAESRTTGIQVSDRLLQVCEELGLQVNCRKSSLIPSQDMTYLSMQIQSVRFIAKPTETWVENLLKIIEEFLSFLAPPPAALWRRPLDHFSSLTLLVKGGMFRMRSLQICLRSRWDFRDELLRIPWDPLCQEDPNGRYTRRWSKIFSTSGRRS